MKLMRVCLATRGVMVEPAAPYRLLTQAPPRSPLPIPPAHAYVTPLLIDPIVLLVRPAREAIIKTASHLCVGCSLRRRRYICQRALKIIAGNITQMGMDKNDSASEERVVTWSTDCSSGKIYLAACK